jgi:hypothetical protein
MNRKSSPFLKQLLQTPDNAVLTSIWLKKERNISNKLQYEYTQSGWLKSIGQGAFIKCNTSEVSFEGALYALQQTGLQIHLGGQFALALKGKLQYARKNNWTLFSERNLTLPRWFSKYAFIDKWKHYRTNFLSNNVGLEMYDIEKLPTIISSAERAVFELLYQAPSDIDLQEASDIFELLRTLRPELIQELLENCSSVKVKRLFLFFADKFQHYWLKYLNLKNIDLGSGIREITKGGKYNKRYNIIIGDLNENE